MMRITQIMESGDAKTALREFEQLLEDQMEAGSKVLPLLNSYYEFMVSSDQINEGVDFLGDYVDDMVEKSDMLPVYERQFFLILRDAYQETGDQKALDKVETRLQEYD
jgi:lipopolysaccharide biosynthesis regulator YciM